MPKQKTDDLIQLIRSLTRAEKRHFRLFVRRNQSSDEILFLQLFDVMDRHKEYDEALIGVNVIEKGTPNATVTDFEGRFTLMVTDTLAKLLISRWCMFAPAKHKEKDECVR